MPRLATPAAARGQAVHQHREDAAGGRLPVREAQVEGAEAVVPARRRGAQRAAELAAVHQLRTW